MSATSPRFYRDDPILREPEPQDASGAAPSQVNLMYELTYNLFALPRHKPSGLRAQNVNTIDEVPDSRWFTNRIGTRALTTDEIVRGPNVGPPPDPSRWVIYQGKDRVAAKSALPPRTPTARPGFSSSTHLTTRRRPRPLS